MNNRDYDLSDRICQGDQSAELELFSNYKEKIVTMVQIRLGSSNPDCEDICSEIQLAILMKLRDGQFDKEKGKLSSYIYGIALNKMKDYYKSVKKERDHFQNMPSYEIFKSEDEKSELENEELQNIMKKVINSLKKKYKEVIYLRYYEGLSVSEIADQLKIEPRRVSERINYSIKLMQKKCSTLDFFSIFRNHLLIYLQKGYGYGL